MPMLKATTCDAFGEPFLVTPRGGEDAKKDHQSDGDDTGRPEGSIREKGLPGGNQTWQAVKYLERCWVSWDFMGFIQNTIGDSNMAN